MFTEALYDGVNFIKKFGTVKTFLYIKFKCICTHKN